MSYYIGWQNRYNGKYKKNSAFSIDIDGKIYQHYDPKFYSNFLNIKDVNEIIISINLVNTGWLTKKIKTNEYFDYIGNPYNGEVINKRWRGKIFWVPYTNKQINSLVELCKYLSNKFGIPLKSIGHNTKVDSVFNYEGIVFKSNFMIEYRDLSPAFDFTSFDNKLE